MSKKLILLSMAALVLSISCAKSSPTGPDELFVIDISHNGTAAYTFGWYHGDRNSFLSSRSLWQTFIAETHPKLVKIEVKIKVDTGGSTLTDVTAQLLATDAQHRPTGDPLAQGSLGSAGVGTDFAVVTIPLAYEGLVPGKEYAILLCQQVPTDSAHYAWAVAQVSPTLYLGRYIFDSLCPCVETPNDDYQWVPGDGWLKLYTSD